MVWQAMDLDRRELVAVKTYDCGTDEAFGRRYVLETRILAMICDRGVVALGVPGERAARRRGRGNFNASRAGKPRFRGQEG